MAFSPSHGVAPCAARPSTRTRIASTPLAATPTSMLVGSPVIAKSPTNPCSSSRSQPRSTSSSDSSSGTTPQADADALRALQVCDREHQGGECALHVVGAAPEEAVALEARLELFLVSGDHVEVPVEQNRVGRVLRPRVGDQDGELPHRQLVDLDVACLEPAAYETRAELDALCVRAVEAHELLGQQSLIHRERTEKWSATARRAR